MWLAMIVVIAMAMVVGDVDHVQVAQNTICCAQASVRLVLVEESRDAAALASLGPTSSMPAGPTGALAASHMRLSCLAEESVKLCEFAVEGPSSRHEGPPVDFLFRPVRRE